MRRLLVVSGIVCSLIMGTLSVAQADNGPHGNYSATTDKCAACHRAHTAAGDRLLIQATADGDMSGFCYTCHSGTGAYTDVLNGNYSGNPGGGTHDTPLRGGGFEQLKMNHALELSYDPSTAPALPISSRHMITGGISTVWGYGDLGTPGVGATGVKLTCTNCHNPHGGAGTGNTATYRILKGDNGSNNTALFTNGTTTVVSGVNVPDESSKTYNVGDGTGQTQYNWQMYSSLYFGEHTGGARNLYGDMTAWCSQCHTRYKATAETVLHPGSTSSGDAMFTFRHLVNSPLPSTGPLLCNTCHQGGSIGDLPTAPPVPGCMNCHVAHGTAATAGGWAAPVAWPDGTTTPLSNERSALLRLDGRGVCQGCHMKQ